MRGYYPQAVVIGDDCSRLGLAIQVGLFYFTE